MTQALGARALVSYPDARYEIEQEKRRRWLVYAAVFLFAIVVALMAVASAPELFSIVFAVLVVLQGVTVESQVHAALDEMRGCEILGVVLNRYHSRIPKRIRQLIGA